MSQPARSCGPTAILVGLMVLFTACSAPSGERSGAFLASRPIQRTLVRSWSCTIVSADWQAGFGLTHDPDRDSIWHQPVQYYLSHPNCSPLARDFYHGILRPTDNDSTRQLLGLATTTNQHLRPFYRWCLNMTIHIRDGALCEYTGKPARQYAEQYPEECLNYLRADSSGIRYQQWTSAITYSGAYPNEIHTSSSSTRRNFLHTMQQNCIFCSQEMKLQLKDFAVDCF